LPVALLANARLVFSRTGSASISVRSITVGPGPFFRIATTPVPPTPVVTSKPSLLGELGQLGRGLVLVEPEFRVAVQVLVQALDRRVVGVELLGQRRRQRFSGRGGTGSAADECRPGKGRCGEWWKASWVKLRFTLR
jgi:hypothetical protein